MNTDQIYHGAAWYPEVWPESEWARDFEKMNELGINTVRIAEFAWKKLEPKDGQYDFDWLERAIDLAHSYNISVVLCTPTACPPLWLFKQDDTMAAVNPDGRKASHGGRHHACLENPLYREYSRKIVSALAKRFGNHPAIVAWQIDNEWRGNQSIDISTCMIDAWHSWLENKYKSIDTLNDKWHTHVWSQHYDKFNEVPPANNPGTVGEQTHSLVVNYQRFISDSAIAFNNEQCKIIRKYSKIPITHNSSCEVDDAKLAKKLDFPSIDSYLQPEKLWDPFYHYDSLRNISNSNGNFWIMETATDGFGGANKLFPKGWLPTFAFASICSGARGFCYWLWRQQASGVEMTHPCVIHSCGRETLGASDIRSASELFTKLTPLLKDLKPAKREAALIRSEENSRYIIQSRANVNCWDQLHNYNRVFFNIGVSRDVVYDSSDSYSDYKLLVIPYLLATSAEFSSKVKAFIENGGVAIIGPETGIRTVENTIPTNAPLGDIEEALGFYTEHVLNNKTREQIRLTHIEGEFHPSSRSCVFKTEEDDVILGTFQDDSSLKDKPWGFGRKLGKGHYYVIGSELPENLRNNLIAKIADDHGLERHPFPKDVYRFPMTHKDGSDVWALVNNTCESIEISLQSKSTDLLTKNSYDKMIQLAPHEPLLLKLGS